MKMGQHGQHQGPTAEKEGRMRLKAQKGKILTTSSTKHQKGRKYIYTVYICQIYIERRIYGYKPRGYVFNVGGDSYLLGNLNERFLQKKRIKKETETNVCIKP